MNILTYTRFIKTSICEYFQAIPLWISKLLCILVVAFWSVQDFFIRVQTYPRFSQVKGIDTCTIFVLNLSNIIYI